MTEHLPECPMLEPCSADTTQHCYCSRRNTCIHDEMECICERLRACEKRMLDDDVFSAAYHGQKGYDVGYAAALGAAWEAVAALPKGGMGQRAHELWRNALAAIDALREDSHD